MVLSMSAISVGSASVDYSDALEVFHQGISRTLREADQTVAMDPPPENLVWHQATTGELTIAIGVSPSTDKIAAVTRKGGTSLAEEAILEQLSRFAVGATPRELIEHGLTHVVERLRDQDAPRPVAGILTPRNAGPCFERPRGLMRALGAILVEANGPFEGDNDFDRPFSEAWLANDPEVKRQRLGGLVELYRQNAGLNASSMEIFEIDRYDRVVVMFGDGVDVWDKPPHLLALERWLRQETGERIEVFVEIAKDSNRIRRL